MNTLSFLDANVWLALIWDRHKHSEIARSWFEEMPERRFLFCRFTQITVLRLLATASVMGRDVRNMKTAWAFGTGLQPMTAWHLFQSPTISNCAFENIQASRAHPRRSGLTLICSPSRRPLG